jgi:hypothetical protein
MDFGAQQAIVFVDAGSDAESVLPSQFFAAPIDPRGEPVKRLMVAVLQEALTTLFGGSGLCEARRAAAGDARDWFASDNRQNPFAFASICDALGLDAGWLRRMISRRLAAGDAFERPRLQSGPGRQQVVQSASRRRAA